MVARLEGLLGELRNTAGFDVVGVEFLQNSAGREGHFALFAGSMADQHVIVDALGAALAMFRRCRSGPWPRHRPNRP